jgi:hypothetical protein
MRRFKLGNRVVVWVVAPAAALVAYESPLRGSPACNESAGPIAYVNLPAHPTGVVTRTGAGFLSR